MDERALNSSRRLWRPNFGLPTLFVMVTLAAMLCAWVAFLLTWDQRDAPSDMPDSSYGELPSQ